MSAHPSVARGILAIWNDYPADDTAFYERWYMTEHFPERLGVPGFLRGRRYRAIDADRAYFTAYELTSPDVLFSEAYLARLNDPTAWTARVMQRWSAMVRTVCRRTARDGTAVGGYAVVARFEGHVEIACGDAARIREQLCDPHVVAVDLWQATSIQNGPTREAGGRPEPDRTIAAAIIVETTSADAARRARERLPGLLSGPARPSATGLYSLVAIADANAHP